MKAIMKKMVALCFCLVAIVSNINAQEFDPKSISDMSRAELRASVEEGNKMQTVAFQKSDGSLGAFDCNGSFLNVIGGYGRIDDMFRPYVAVSWSWEALPTYRLDYKEMPDGRIVRDWRYAFSLEVLAHAGYRRYIEDADSEGKYWSYGATAYVKWRIPGFDKWTNYRFAINLMVGGGFVYGRYDKTVGDVYVWNNGFGAVLESMTEFRFRPSKQLAMAIFIRGGVTTIPGFALNEVWTSWRGKGEFGIAIPLNPSHRSLRVSD